MRITALILLLTNLAIIAEAGVIAYWRFEDVEKYAGAGRLVSYDTSETWGIVNPALYDDVSTTVIPATGESNAHSTTGGYIGQEFGDAEIILEDQFTIECYLNFNGWDESGWLSPIMGFGGRFQGSSLGLHFSYIPEYGDDGSTIRFRVSSQGDRYYSDPFDFVFGEWFHYAFVKDGDFGRFYINGDLWWEFEGGLEDYYAWGNWMDYEMGIGSSWRGYMDEFRISDVALNPNQFLNYAAIPEPSTFALLALGGAFLAGQRKRRSCFFTSATKKTFVA